MGPCVIQTAGLTRRYRQLTAVNGLDLNVPVGSIYGFLGPNGAGKTTTIRMLLGLIRPTAGSIRVFGQPVNRDLARGSGRIGSLVEHASYYPNLTGRENLEVLRRMHRGESAWVKRALAIVGLERDADRLAQHYSQGMLQRLGLGMALLSSPELLILDEPTNGLDPAGIHEIRDLIRSLPQEFGVSVFISSHLLSEVEQMATCIGIIQKGRLVFEGTPDELRAAYPPRLNLQVDAPDVARRALSQAGWQASPNGVGGLSLPVSEPEKAAAVNACLVQSGLEVYELCLEQPSLEDIFLRLTETQPIPQEAAQCVH